MKISYRLVRRTVQFAVLLFLIAVPILNLHQRIHAVHGNLLSFNFFGIPFNDPAAALQVALAAFATPLRMAAGAGLVLLLALIMGPVFCGWLCPFGLLSELVHRKPKKQDTKQTAYQVVGEMPSAFWIKCAVFFTGLVAALYLARTPLLNQLSMPGWVSRILQHAVLYKEILWGAGLVLAVLVLEALLKKRFWCRYVCPQSFLLWVAGMVLPVRFQVRFNRRACTCPASDRLCRKSCTLALDPRKTVIAQRVQCVNCADCIDACNTRGKALAFGFGKFRE